MRELKLNPKLPLSTRAGMAGTRALDAIVRALMLALAMLKERRTGMLALIAVAIFYIPALFYGSDIAIGGDILGWYMPALAKTHALLHSLHFTALDFSSFNGSSDFFLSPNFFAFHPVVVLYALFAPAAAVTPTGIANLLTVMLALHSLAAVYFGIRLLTRFFLLEYPVAVFATLMFAFSPYMVLNAAPSPPFFFAATIMPWAAYSALSFATAPTLRGLLFGSLPVVFGFTAGYLPLGVACLGMAALLVAGRLLFLEQGPELEQRLRNLAAAAAPFVLGALVMGLYLFSVFSFHKETSSAGVPSLFFSAHQLGESPQSILRLFSTRLYLPGAVYEFSLYWGVIAVIAAALFVFTPRAMASLTPTEWPLLKFCAVIYFVTLLAMFGQFSPVSDLVYYFVPQVGKMHIYQRFLLPAQLLFAIMVALMVRTLVDLRPPFATRVAVAVLGCATVAAACMLVFAPAQAQAAHINGYVVFELGLGFLFAVALLVPGRNFVFAAVIALAMLPSLDHMYDRSVAEAIFTNNLRERLALDPKVREPFVAWVKNRFPGRDVIKYVDVTPMWTAKGVEPFPKVFPFYVLQELPLSSYGGFTFYLSARADYIQRMPVTGDVQLKPDWEYVTRTGADFAVGTTADLSGPLGEQAARAGTTGEDMYYLPNDVVVVPLRPRNSPALAADGTRYENGMFRVAPIGFDMAKLRRTNVALHKKATQTGDGVGKAALAVDGNTNGDFAAGSVSHSARDQDAWLDIDLGEVQQVDEIRLWNRTDSAGYRLRNYFVFVSEEPFLPTETAEMVQARPGVWARQGSTPTPSTSLQTGGVRGRYVRLQFDGRQPPQDSYLALAEVEVFRWHPDDARRIRDQVAGIVKVGGFESDFAQRADLHFEVNVPSRVDYLFWDNPRLSFYLDGEEVRPRVEDKVLALNVGAGKHTLELRYRHWPLRLFWLVYALYFLALLAAVAWPIARRLRARRNMAGTENKE